LAIALNIDSLGFSLENYLWLIWDETDRVRRSCNILLLILFNLFGDPPDRFVIVFWWGWRKTDLKNRRSCLKNSQ
jgi:hypothetical protein